MENNIGKEQWIDGVINSTRGLRKAEPANDLFDKVKGGLSQPVVRTQIPVLKWVAAATLLLALNLASILYYTSQTSTGNTTSSANPIAAEMQAETTYNY